MSTHSIRNVGQVSTPSLKGSKHLLVGAILLVALFAFEVFNFDTTRFALDNLLGESSFVGLKWATVLAIAFCAIDFAGLARIFTPEQGLDEPKEVWYLMGAWLLGATMNAIMTWWAVSLTLLDNEFGNEVLSRQQLLTYVPIFVAILVWLTRILFIGALSVASDHILHNDQEDARVSAPKASARKTRIIKTHRPVQPQAVHLTPTSQPLHRPVTAVPMMLIEEEEPLLDDDTFMLTVEPEVTFDVESDFIDLVHNVDIPTHKRATVRKVSRPQPRAHSANKQPRTRITPMARTPQTRPAASMHANEF